MKGYRYCYPWKPEHDPLGQDTPWHDDGVTILMGLGAIGCYCNVHEANKKLRKERNYEEEDRLFWERKGKTPPNLHENKSKNENISIDTSKYFGVDGMRRF